MFFPPACSFHTGTMEAPTRKWFIEGIWKHWWRKCQGNVLSSWGEWSDDQENDACWTDNILTECLQVSWSGLIMYLGLFLQVFAVKVELSVHGIILKQQRTIQPFTCEHWTKWSVQEKLHQAARYFVYPPPPAFWGTESAPAPKTSLFILWWGRAGLGWEV